MHVHIGISTYRGMGRESMSAIRVAEERLRMEPGFIVDSPTYYGTALLARARNDFLAGTLKELPEVDKIVFIDDDMQPEPDALVKLCKHAAPVVSALCTTRTPPLDLAVKMWDEKTQQFWMMDRLPMGYPSSGQYAPGAAFLAVTREAALQMVEHYCTAQDWMKDNKGLFDALHVRLDRREAVRKEKEKQRRENWEKHNFIQLFETKMTETGQDAGEDVIFGLRCIQAGIPITIDPTIIVGHLGLYPFGPWMYKPQNTVEMEQRVRENGLVGNPTKVA